MSRGLSCLLEVLGIRFFDFRHFMSTIAIRYHFSQKLKTNTSLVVFFPADMRRKARRFTLKK